MDTKPSIILLPEKKVVVQQFVTAYSLKAMIDYLSITPYEQESYIPIQLLELRIHAYQQEVVDSQACIGTWEREKHT